MAFTTSTLALNHAGVMTALSAAVAKAEEIGQPQCIVVVDASGETQGQIRMTGAKYLSLKSAMAKARTAASIRGASDAIPEAVRTGIGLATGGEVTGLPGGLPVVIDGVCVGGIGVGSGTGEQDITVAKAGLAAIGAEA